jgi:predicted nucleotide-binding protein (sugar kinase/HSP70/actin superfamily)
MVVSVKPFGCMPSIQSDGVQSKVARDLGSIFISVETSGDAEANVKSRIQMRLYEAKRKALERYEKALLKFNLSEGKIKTLLDKKPEVKRGDFAPPERGPVTAVNTLYYLVGV